METTVMGEGNLAFLRGFSYAILEHVLFLRPYVTNPISKAYGLLTVHTNLVGNRLFRKENLLSRP